MENLERCFVSKTKLDKCYREWSEIDPSIVGSMKERKKHNVCKLQGLIKKEESAKNIWANHFLGQKYLDFTNLHEYNGKEQS